MKEKDDIPEHLVDESAKSLYVQQHTREKAEQRAGTLKNDLDELGKLNDAQDKSLDDMMAIAGQLMSAQENNEPMTEVDDYSAELNKLSEADYSPLDYVATDENESWEDFLAKTEAYGERHHLNLEEDPFSNLLTSRQESELIKRIQDDYKMDVAKCDKYDYLIAGFCGTASGLIDSFFVGEPRDSKLGNWTDDKVDKVVIKFTNRIWHRDRKTNKRLKFDNEPEEIAQALGYLERNYHVNYDARYAKDLKMGEESLKMSTTNHHLKSLGHSPDIIGLFFSILDQFTGKASFISDGKIIRLEPIESKKKFELRGDTLIAKLYAGFANWLGHLMSDVAGSSGTRGHKPELGEAPKIKPRGTGIPIPFYALFQSFNFGSIPDAGVNKTIAEFSASVFETGYDARFGVTMAIPVAFNELSIRLLWGFKSKFYHERSWEESMPAGNKPELRRMLVVGHGALCLVDGVDAYIRTGGVNPLFAARINIMAWSRFSFSALLEVRGLYKESGFDLVALENDIEQEWDRLFQD